MTSYGIYTTPELTLGQHEFSVIEATGNKDWYKVNLTKNFTYEIYMEGVNYSNWGGLEAGIGALMLVWEERPVG
jgi:hypothetical protein